MGHGERKTGSATVGLIVLGLMVLYAVGIDSELGVYGDNGVYLLLAKSIADDGTYRDIEQPGQPPHLQNPPLFPALLAPFVRLGGLTGAVVAIKIAIALTGLLAAALTYRWAAGRTGPRVASLAAGGIALSPFYYQYALSVMSDIPATLLTMLAVIAATRYAKSQSWGGRDLLLCALAISAAGMIRTIGWMLAPATAVALLFGTRAGTLPFKLRLTKCVALALLCLLPMAGWQIRCGLAKEAADLQKGSYLDVMLLVDPQDESQGNVDGAGMIRRIGRNGAAHSLNLMNALLPKSEEGLTRISPALPQPVAYALAGIVLASSVFLFIRTRDLAEGYLLLVVAVLLIWPWNGARFLVPLYPFLFVHFFTLAGQAGKALRAPRLIPYLALLAFLPGALLGAGRWIGATQTGDTDAKWGEGWANYRAMVEHAAKLGDETTVIMSRKHGLVYCWTGKRSVIVPYTSDKDEFLRKIDEYKVNTLIVDDVGDLIRNLSAGPIKANPARFEEIDYPQGASKRRGKIYRIKQP